MSDQSQLQFCRLNYYHWSLIFMFLQCLQFSAVFSSVVLQDWVFTSMSVNSSITFESLTFDGTSFSGSLYSCNSGCKGHYSKNMQDWCLYSTTSQTYPSKSICTLFTALTYSSMLFTVFQVLGILMGLQLFCCILVVKKSKYQWLRYCFSVSSLIFFYVGGLLWVFINDVGIRNDCSKFPQRGNKVAVCVSNGPVAICVLLIISPLITLLYNGVMWRLNKERRGGQVSDFRENSVLGNSASGLFGQSASMEGNIDGGLNDRVISYHQVERGKEIILEQVTAEREKNDSEVCVDTNIPLNKLEN